MAYSEELAERLRTYLQNKKVEKVTEKKMFGGLGFMVDDKMCINVKEDKLMCRYDPEKHEEIMKKKGYESMVMRGKVTKAYCYVSEEGYKTDKQFAYWVELCLEYNPKAKSSKKK